jgi:phage terminase large subunit-like protein
MAEIFHCACCGGDFPAGDDATARSEAHHRGVDPDSPLSTTVCNECFTIMQGEMKDDQAFLYRLHRWRDALSPASCGQRIMAKFREYPHLRRGRLVSVMAGGDSVEVVLDRSDAISRVEIWRLYPEPPPSAS